MIGSPRGEGVAKKILSCLMALAVVCIFGVAASAQQQTQNARDKHAEKIRKYVKRLKRWDVGDPVTVKLNDGTKIKGHVTEITDDYFVVADRKKGQSTSIYYSNVMDVSEGKGTRTKIGIVFSGAVLALVGICAVTHGCRE